MADPKSQRVESRFAFAHNPESSTRTSKICAATKCIMEAMSCINQQLASNTMSSEHAHELRVQLDTLDLQLAKLLDHQTDAANDAFARTLVHLEDAENTFPQNKKNEETRNDEGFVPVRRYGKH